MKEQLIQHRDRLMAKGRSIGSASWFAVRDMAFEDKRFNLWVCRLFGLGGGITDLTQKQAIKLIENIKV